MERMVRATQKVGVDRVDDSRRRPLKIRFYFAVARVADSFHSKKNACHRIFTMLPCPVLLRARSVVPDTAAHLPHRLEPFPVSSVDVVPAAGRFQTDLKCPLTLSMELVRFGASTCQWLDHPAFLFAQLFGYDVMVDENLRPWLLEVNASPSLGASNLEDFRLKKQMVGGVFDIVDVEGRRVFVSATAA